MSDRYLTVEETTAIIARHRGSGDEYRRAWESADEADQEAAVMLAADAIDVLAYKGLKSSAEQTRQFPRYQHGDLYQPTGELTLPDGIDAWSVGSLPREVRLAAAIQAANEIRRMRRTDPNMHAAEKAHAGIVASSGAGQSVTLDRLKAESPYTRICAEAFAILDRLRRASGEMV